MNLFTCDDVDYRPGETKWVVGFFDKVLGFRFSPEDSLEMIEVDGIPANNTEKLGLSLVIPKEML